MPSRKLSRLLAIALLGAPAVPVMAQSINVNFRGISGAPVADTAGVYRVPASGAAWNNFTGANGTSATLLDSGGAVSGAQLAWEAQASWQTVCPTAGEDANLVDGYLAVGSENYDYDVTVTGIPYASYDVIVYFGNNAMGADGNLRINGGGTQFFYRTAGILPAFTGFDQVTARTSDTTEDGNYARFDGVAGSTLVIQQANIGGGQDSGIMGFQIVDRGAALPYASLAQSVYTNADDIAVSFVNGTDDPISNFVLVPRGAAPTSTPLARLYVGGGATPGGAPASGTVTFADGGGLSYGWFDLYWLADVAGNSVLAGPVTFQVNPPEPTVVPIGGGSIASAPPAHEGTYVLNEVYQREFFVDPSAAGRPIPTNDWWTDMVISRYAGEMWAYPLTISADAQGANVFFPTTWAGDGGSMVLTQPIEVHGEVVPDVDPSVIYVEQFEGTAYAAGWTTTGTAFGAGPAAGTLPGQGTVSGFVGSRLVNSFNGGDGPVGTLTSPTFTIDRRYLHLLVGGGNHPTTFGGGSDATAAAVSLYVGGVPVATATGTNSEAMTPRTWDLAAYVGQTAELRIVDNATGGWGHILCDQVFLSASSDFSSGAGSNVFTPTAARALDWGDWTVTARMEHSAGKHLDMTFGHGLPFTWFEPNNVTPLLRMDGGATFFDTSGAVSLATPRVTDVLGITIGSRSWGLFLPDNTTVTWTAGTLRLSFPSADDYFVLAPLPNAASLSAFHARAYSVPRDSVYSWVHDRQAGLVRTTWDLQMDVLKGAGNGTYQGWIPHHYRNTTNDLAMAAGIEYDTPRGRMRCSTGSTFHIDFPFSGYVPMTPAPQPIGASNDYSAALMTSELAKAATLTGYGADTYFGGKDLVRLAHYLAMARETGNTASATTLRNTLRTALTDWFTYTPGEREHYFARFANYGGVVGFNESFFSFQFTDHHFHYGYFTTAAATLAMYDPTFLPQYGEMARLLARDYANWDRNDTEFPFLRCFDIWAGHSLAGGFSSPGGNNQESSSEAIQSWAGLLYLGRMMGDDEMAATGAMGAAIESAATLEYWYDYNGDTLPAQYPRTVVGILFDRGPAFATFFSGDPGWIYGIQWLPLHPAQMAYLSRDPAFAEQKWNEMVADRISLGFGATDIANDGSSLGNILLGFQALYDQDLAASEWARLDAINSPVVENADIGGITYYFIHSMRRHGTVRADYHLSEPLGNVLHDADSGVTTYVAFNPEATAQEITVYQNGSAIGCFTAPPGVLTAVTALSPCSVTSIPDAFIIE